MIPDTFPRIQFFIHHLQEDIRKHSRLLMGRETKNSPFDMIASQEKVDMWDPDNAEECCNEDNFLPSFEESSKSAYNQSCTRVFEASFKAEHSYWADHYDVRKAFSTHLDYLKEVHKKMASSNASTAEAVQDKSTRRRRERKYQVGTLTVSSFFSNIQCSSSAALPDCRQDPER